MLRVALLDDYQGVARRMADWSALPAGTELIVFHDHLSDLDAVARRLADFDVVMALRERTPFARALFERLPRLKLLVTAGMRNASIDLRAATERGVRICGAAGLPYPTAELTWGLILSLVRHISAEDRATREGRWQLGLGLNGKTLGVLGLGTLGSRVTRVGRVFDFALLGSRSARALNGHPRTPRARASLGPRLARHVTRHGADARAAGRSESQSH